MTPYNLRLVCDLATPCDTTSAKMASQSAGIQQLLQAEKRAAEKVAEARKRKAKRLKQAKEEAQTEIEAYKKEREKMFADYEAEHMGKREDVMKEIERDMRAQISTMTSQVENNKEAVICRILDMVYDIKPELHANAKY